MQGLNAGGLSNDTPLGFVDFWGGHPRIIAQTKIRKCKESGLSRAGGGRPWAKGAKSPDFEPLAL